MTAKERILALRFLKKQDKNPDLTKSLGMTIKWELNEDQSGEKDKINMSSSNGEILK